MAEVIILKIVFNHSKYRSNGPKHKPFKTVPISRVNLPLWN